MITCNCGVCTSTDPRDQRLRSSVLIEKDGKVLVIDTGPDFRQQMLKSRVQQLDGILITHEHKDHVAGLDDVRAFNFKTRAPVDLYGEKRALDSIRREFAYIFADHRYPGIPQINMHLIDPHRFEIQGIEIIPVRAMHMKLPVLGFRIDNFTYLTDTNYVAPEEIEKIKNSKVFVINALRKKSHISHYNLEEAVELINKVKPREAYLTHISHMMGLHEEVEKELPENIHMAYDGLQLEL